MNLWFILILRFVISFAKLMDLEMIYWLLSIRYSFNTIARIVATL
jgi:hypothetical protein